GQNIGTEPHGSEAIEVVGEGEGNERRETQERDHFPAAAGDRPVDRRKLRMISRELLDSIPRDIARNEEGQSRGGRGGGRDQDRPPEKPEEIAGSERQRKARHEENRGDDVEDRVEESAQSSQAGNPAAEASEPLGERQQSSRGEEKDHADAGGEPSPSE